MRALFWPAKNFIKIVAATALELSPNRYALKIATSNKWRLLTPGESLSEPAFAGVLASLTASYANFMQNAQLVSVYR